MRHRAGARQRGASLGLRLRGSTGREWEVLLRPSLDVASPPNAATCEDLGGLREVLPVGVAGGAGSAHAEDLHDLGEAQQIVGGHEGESKGEVRQTWD
jgi:hypothetical protein